jgi:hypothetical protein
MTCKVAKRDPSGLASWRRAASAGRGGGSDGKGPVRTAAIVLVALCLAALMTGVLSASAGAVPSDTVAKQIAGIPLSVYVGPRGQCQSSYTVNGQVEGNFYPGGGNEFLAPFSPVGDCGFFLAFPEGAGQPTNLVSKTFGFSGTAGPSMSNVYTPVSQSDVSGDGSAANPFLQTTVFKVVDSGAKEDAQITETTTYVNGAPQFSSKYDVKNTSGSPLFFRAMYAGDLYVNGDDHGVGVLLGGPPRFIGGQNASSGVLGGLQEEPLPALAWSSLEELSYPAVWTKVTGTVADEKAFEGKFELENVDNAVGVEWDQFRSTALASGKEASFSIVNRTQVPSGLGVSPATQTHPVGQTASVTVTAVDTAGTPYANRPLVYKIEGANPKTGSVTTNAGGQAVISYIGTAPGIDTMQMFLDLAGTGVQAPQDPAAAATVTWQPAPPTPSSSYKVQSIKANSDGTITIVFVPSQDGTATVEVTVPTGTISRNASLAKKKCKKNQVRIKGKCRPKTTVSGKVTAAGKGGVPLKITVKPSRKVKKALAKGKKVQLTAKLTYKSLLGGSPTVRSFHFTVKARKKTKKHR